jgi:DNA-binding transcriptional regulator YhcF (GntR family)
MAPSATAKPVEAGADRVRARLLTALHLGRLQPGDRVPSVRRFAHVTGVNPKAVHRAYRILADEGFLEVRPGSGTFVSRGPSPGTPGRPTESELLSTLNRCRAEALRLGLTPMQFASFLDRGLGASLGALRLAVVECNHEQIGLIAAELKASMGVRAVPVLLRDLRAEPRRCLQPLSAVVTTDCHRAEVAAIVDPLGIPVHRVALDPTFPEGVIEHARHGPVVMIVRDESFGPVFQRLLRQMTGSAQIAARVRVVNLFQAQSALAQTPHAWVYLSPLVEELAARLLAAGHRKVEAHWRIERDSLDRLQAGLAFDLIRGRHTSRAS